MSSIWCPAGHEFKNPNPEFNMNGGMCVACQKNVRWSFTEPPKCAMCGKHFPNEALLYSHVAHAHQIADFGDAQDAEAVSEQLARSLGAPVQNGNCLTCGGMTFTGMGHLCPREFREPSLLDWFAMHAPLPLVDSLRSDEEMLERAKFRYRWARAMMEARKVKP